MPYRVSDDMITFVGGDKIRRHFNSLDAVVKVLRKIAKPGDTVSLFLPPDTHLGLVFGGGERNPNGAQHRIEVRDAGALLTMALYEILRAAQKAEK